MDQDITVQLFRFALPAFRHNRAANWRWQGTQKEEEIGR